MDEIKRHIMNKIEIMKNDINKKETGLNRLRYDLERFLNINDITFCECKDCDGSGEIQYIDGTNAWRKCDNCNSTGYDIIPRNKEEK